MNTELAAEAVEFEQSVAAALAATGGFEHVRRAEQDHHYRYVVGEQLAKLEVWDIDTDDDLQLEAAALACRAAGRVALPYPIAERIAAQRVHGSDAVGMVGSATPRLAHADMDMRWVAIGVDGRTAQVVQSGGAGHAKISRFVTNVELGVWGDPTDAGPLLLILQAWTLLGMIQAAQEMTSGYVRDRRQFGQALGEFQSVQFALTDVAVATQGLEELCKYTLWAFRHRPDDAFTDALLLRVASLEAAETAFRVGHQLHGAIGFCDETDISWLSRHSQSLRRLPLGRSRTEAILADRVRGLGVYSPVVGGGSRGPA